MIFTLNSHVELKLEHRDKPFFSSFNKLVIFISKFTKEYNDVKRESYNLAIIDKENEVIKVPIGYSKLIYSKLKGVFKNKNFITIRDERVNKNARNPFVHKYAPRDKLQKRTLNKILKDPNGHIIVPCGGGKTYLALKTAEELKKKTLILVDEIMLLDQWKEDILDVCGYHIDSFGEIHGSTKVYEGRDLIIATKQSVLNDERIAEYLINNISFLIVDECHTVATKVYTDILSKFKPKYILGLTATPERTDGFDFLLHASLGRVLDVITQKELIDAGSILKSKIIPIFVTDKNRKLSINFWDKKLDGKKFHISNWIKMIDELYACDSLHKVVAKNIYNSYKHGYVSACILSRIDWINKYYKLLIQMGVPENEIEIIKGDTEKDYRKDVIDRAKRGEIKIILTSKLLDKGISINRLDCLHLVYPSKASGNVEQRVGRIARLHAEKKQVPIVFDYLFDNYLYFNQLFNQYKFSRYKAYLKTSDVSVLDKFIYHLNPYFNSRSKSERDDLRLNVVSDLRPMKKHIMIA